MTTTTLHRSAILSLDVAQEIRQELLRHWGDDDAVCVGHAYDGVLWGRIAARQLHIPSDTHQGRGARLRWGTLLDLRVFNERKELRVWRVGAAFEALLLADSDSAGDRDGLYTASEEVYFRTMDFELIRSPKTPKEPEQAAEFFELKGLAGQVHYPPGPAPEKLSARLYYQANPETGIVRCIDNRLLSLVPMRTGK